MNHYDPDREEWFTVDEINTARLRNAEVAMLKAEVERLQKIIAQYDAGNVSLYETNNQHLAIIDKLRRKLKRARRDRSEARDIQAQEATRGDYAVEVLNAERDVARNEALEEAADLAEYQGCDAGDAIAATIRAMKRPSATGRPPTAPTPPPQVEARSRWTTTPLAADWHAPERVGGQEVEIGISQPGQHVGGVDAMGSYAMVDGKKSYLSDWHPSDVGGTGGHKE